MSNAKYYFHKESISEPEGFSTFSNFRKYMGYLWDSLTSLYRTEALGDFMDFNGDSNLWGTTVPVNWEGSDGYVSSGEMFITMFDTTEYEGSITDAGGVTHPLKSYKFEVFGNAGTTAETYATPREFEDDIKAFFQEGVAHYDGTFACHEPTYIKGISNYNFFQEEYEAFAMNPDVSERSLPNAYFNHLYYIGNVSQTIEEDRRDYPDLYEHVSLFNNIDTSLSLQYVSLESLAADPMLDTTLTNYYRDFANAFDDVNVDNINKINKKNEKILFPFKMYKDDFTYNSEIVNLELFRHPFYGGLEFNRALPEDYFGDTDSVVVGGSYAASVTGRSLDFCFASWTLSEASESPPGYNLSNPSEHFNQYTDLFEVYRESDASSETISLGHKHAALWADDPDQYSDPASGVTVPSFFSSVDKQCYFPYNPPDSTKPLLNFYSVCPESEDLFMQNVENGGFREVSGDSFLDDLYTIEHDKARGFKELFQDGELAYTETLGYRVTKKAENEDGEVIQQIYIPNSLHSVPDDTIRYLDTQVKFDKRYYYEVHEIKYVMGQEYKFSVESVTENRDSAPVITHIEFTFASPISHFADPFMNDGIAIDRAPTPRWAHASSITYQYDANADSNWGNYFPKMLTLGDGTGGRIAPFNSWTCAGFGDVCIDRVVIARPGPIIDPESLVNPVGDLIIGEWPTDVYDEPPNISYLNVSDDLTIRDYPYVGDEKELELSGFECEDPGYCGDVNIYRYRIPVKWLQAHKLAGGDMMEDHVPALDPDKVYTSITELRGDFTDYLSQFPDLFVDGDGYYVGTALFVPESVVPFGIEAVYSEDESVAGAGPALSYLGSVDLQIYPKSSIVAVPYGSVDSKISDMPPRKPEVNIIPYRSVSDKILLSFTCAFGTNIEFPIAIEPGDQEVIDFMPRDPANESLVTYTSGERVVDGHTIGYDDYPDHIEVYRTTTKPTSYKDFAGKLRMKVSTYFSDKPNVIRNLSPSIEDNLQPNTKYYYTFRCVDFHGVFSNPTSIYEVEMVDDGGSVYPLINSYHPEDVATVDGTKNFKKLLLIRPNMQQSMLTTEEEGIKNEWGLALDGTTTTPDTLNTAKLGGGLYDENTLWGKKFKFRIRSTETGKKIDLNVNFKTKTEDE